MGDKDTVFIGIFAIFLSIAFTIPPVWAESDDYNDLLDKIKEDYPWLYEIITEKESGISSSSGEVNEQYTRPTFGFSHENNQKIVDSGFRMNNQTFSISDNFYTPFEEQTVNIGEENFFEVEMYAEKGLKVQEFLFGVPEVGDAHLAEAAIEIWFDYDGEILQTKVVQESNVIDESSLVTTHEKSKCMSSDIEEKCDTVKASIKFLEPLKDKVMAIKAIDFKNRYQITYLNEGIHLSGESLNPLNTMMIPSGLKGEGLIKITQLGKYSPYWASEDKRLFEKNRFDSFKEINYEFERFHDAGEARTRSHSEFGGVLNYEKKRASQIFDAGSLISEIPESFKYEFPERDTRISEKIKTEMIIQETIAQNILDQYNVQARWY